MICQVVVFLLAFLVEIITYKEMFGTVATAAVKKIVSIGQLRRREILIVAVLLGIGLGLAYVPKVLSQTPNAIQQTFGSAITLDRGGYLNCFPPTCVLQLSCEKNPPVLPSQLPRLFPHLQNQ